MSNDYPIYGNVSAGEHPATYQNFRNVPFPNGGYRTIVGFLILNDACDAPLLAPDAQAYWAVAVCNKSQGISPQSSLFRIRKAMLRADEYDAFKNVTEVPDWEAFAPPPENPTARIIWIRVEQRLTKKGGSVSQITHIKRPRDGVWEAIQGTFQGQNYQPAAARAA